jgi:predicted RNA-binding Zn-ribbon protein involved in translation (DUF1610 family)
MIEIAGAIAAFKAVKDLGKTIFDAKVDTDVQAKVLDVMTKVGEAQDTMYALREENIKLQAENERLKRDAAGADDWSSKLAKLVLLETHGGAVVYQNTGEPPYYACPSCVNEKRIVPLQDNRTMSGKYRCVACDAEYPIKQQNRAARSDPSGHDPLSWMAR